MWITQGKALIMTPFHYVSPLAYAISLRPLMHLLSIIPSF